MPRYKLTIEYDGGPFVGWQRQDNGPSIQGEIESAIQSFAGEDASLYGAGRTDAGVHAWGQVAHVDIARNHDSDTVRDALNYYLKEHPISIVGAELVSEDFHARFSATRRSYVYLILSRRAPPAIDRRRVWHVPVDLDAGLMNDAARRLLGRHDFTSFRASQCQAKSPVKTLDVLRFERDGERLVVTVEARSFLHNQVRAMVGSLKLVGEGKWSANDLQDALERRDRAAAGPTAPAHGLYLSAVSYD